LAEAAASALKVFGEAIEALAHGILKRHYPDPVKRRDFGKRIRADIENPEYRLYTFS
jgi:hypothetical protein